jgi:hypothetical protein
MTFTLPVLNWTHPLLPAATSTGTATDAEKAEVFFSNGKTDV